MLQRRCTGAPCSPGFPVEFGGAGELHAAFLTESRTREPAYPACRKFGSHQRTWDENDGRSPSNVRLFLESENLPDTGVKAFEKARFRPMYAAANMGHPYSVVTRGAW